MSEESDVSNRRRGILSKALTGLCIAVIAVGLDSGPGLRAQPGQGGGTTAEGDALRGRGRFCRDGRVRARDGPGEALEAEAVIAWNRAVRADYEQYLAGRAGHGGMLVADGTDHNWPLPFRRSALDRERAAYEKAVAGVVDKCRKGVKLQAADYEGLRGRVAELKKAVDTAVPTKDNRRSQALAFVRRLDEATRISPSSRTPSSSSAT